MKDADLIKTAKERANDPGNPEAALFGLLADRLESLVGPEARKIAVIDKYYEANLDPEVETLWNELKGLENITARQAVLIARANPDFDKQRLFVYALGKTNFDINRVCTTLGISKKRLDSWISGSPEFAELLEAVQWAKKNFVESKMMELVAKGNAKAVIAANETLNNDRGYAKELKITGRVEHVPGMIDFTKYDMPPELRGALLDWMQETGLVDVDGLLVTDTIDAEFKRA